MKTEGYLFRVRVGLVLTLVAALSAGCGDGADASNQPVATPTPSPTPVVAEYPLQASYYLVARKEGLLCLGQQIGDEPEEIFGGSRLWIAWPPQTGLRFESFLPYEDTPPPRAELYHVESVEERLETDAGNFEHVATLSSVDRSYLRYDFWFATGAGIVAKSFGAGRGNLTYTLKSYSVSRSTSPYDSRFALAVGNHWEYSLQGNDSVSGQYSGHVTESISGVRTVAGEPAYVLQMSGTLILTQP